MMEVKRNRKAHLLAFVVGCSGAVVVPSFAHEGGHHEGEPSEALVEFEAVQQSEHEAQAIEPMILLPSYQCYWTRTGAGPGTGGMRSFCKEGEVPFVSGVTGESKDDNCPLTNLSPARQGDGKVEGEFLADGHPEIHGEPLETRDRDPGDTNRGKVGTARHISARYRDIDHCKPRQAQATLTLCCSRDFPFDSLNTDAMGQVAR